MIQVFFSIIVTTYNRKDLLHRAIESIAAQTYRNFEVIVVNDDGVSVENIIEEYLTKFPIKLINNESNNGPAASRNIAIKESKGDYVTFLDDDDIYFPNHLDTLYRESSDEFNVLYTDASRRVYKIIDGKQVEIDNYIPYSIEYHPDKLFIGNITPINCVAIKRNVLLDLHFNETLQALEDWEFLIRLSASNKFKHIAKTTCEVTWIVNGENITSKRSNEQTNAREMIYTLYADKINNIENRDVIISEFNKIWEKDRFLEAKQISIVVPVFNNLAYTKAFVASVKETVKLDYELILVDDISSDGTDNYLRELSARDNKVKIIFNDLKLGFPGSVNQGIKVSNGHTILIANNDIILNKGSIHRMFDLLNSNQEFGIVAPISNAVMGPQLDLEAKYNDLYEMRDYAVAVLKAQANKINIFPRVTFLCVLIKREVINKLGGLDERFAPGNFEDDDYCLRTQMEGYKTVIAQDVFIHHFGSKSFKADGDEKYNALIKTNFKKFVDKWGAGTEDIWLRNFPHNNRTTLIPFHPDRYTELNLRLQSLLSENDYSAALLETENILNYVKTTHTVIPENNLSVITALHEKLCKLNTQV